jgi:hypothetical protein
MTRGSRCAEAVGWGLPRAALEDSLCPGLLSIAPLGRFCQRLAAIRLIGKAAS